MKEPGSNASELPAAGSRPLRVLQISHDYKGPFQSICHLFCQAFTDAEVTTVYLRGKAETAVVDRTGGDRVLFLDQKPGSLRGLKLSALWQLSRIFKDQSFDIVIAHRYKAIYLAGIMSFFYPISILLGMAHEHNVLSRSMRKFFVAILRPNIQMIGVSSSVRDNLQMDCPSLAQQNRLFRLGNAIDPSIKKDFLSRNEARQALAIPEDVFCFGTVGRLVKKKDHQTLITAYGAIASAEDRLVIVGSGDNENQLKRLVCELGIEQQVIFTGNVAQAYRVYAAFDAFVFSSDAREAFGLVLLEAMLAQVPVVCSNAPGPNEVVGDVALMFECGNPASLAQQLLNVRQMTDADRSKQSAAAYERLISRYTEARFVSELRSLPPLAAHKE